MHKGFHCFEKRVYVDHPYFEVLNLRRPHEAVTGDTLFNIYLFGCARSCLQNMGSLDVACELLAVVCGI